MPRVIIIGIDGMDKDLISKFEKDLPNIKKIKNGSSLQLKMVWSNEFLDPKIVG